MTERTQHHWDVSERAKILWGGLTEGKGSTTNGQFYFSMISFACKQKMRIGSECTNFSHFLESMFEFCKVRNVGEVQRRKWNLSTNSI